MRWILLLLATLCSAAELENTNVAGPEAAPVFAEHQPFATTIVVRNPHDRAVRIDRLDASCTCMQLEMAERFILPFQTTTLAINVDNANRSGAQRMGVTAYVTDPELEPIEIQVWWQVEPDVAVDGISPLADPGERPTDRAWRDVYKYVEHERPDELNRLRKRVRLQGNNPEFAVLGIDYDGPVWAFTPARQADGSWLVTSRAKDPAGTLLAKTYDERVEIRTNHPHKPTVTLQFVAVISPDAGRKVIDPLAPSP